MALLFPGVAGLLFPGVAGPIGIIEPERGWEQGQDKAAPRSKQLEDNRWMINESQDCVP